MHQTGFPIGGHFDAPLRPGSIAGYGHGTEGKAENVFPDSLRIAAQPLNSHPYEMQRIFRMNSHAEQGRVMRLRGGHFRIEQTELLQLQQIVAHKKHGCTHTFSYFRIDQGQTHELLFQEQRVERRQQGHHAVAAQIGLERPGLPEETDTARCWR